MWVLRALLYPAYLCTAWPIVATFRLAAWILGCVGSLLGLGPPPLCSLTVARRVVRWEEGRCVLFDDSFVHSAEYREPERVRAMTRGTTWTIRRVRNGETRIG